MRAEAGADANEDSKAADTERSSAFHKLLELEGYVLWDTGNSGTPGADNLALMLTTSGSTGSPKIVRLSKKNLLSNARSIISYLHITDKKRPVLGLPMNYAFGLSIVNSHLLSGATLLLTEHSFVEREFIDFAVSNGFTSYSGVRTVCEVVRGAHRIGSTSTKWKITVHPDDAECFLIKDDEGHCLGTEETEWLAKSSSAYSSASRSNKIKIYKRVD